MSILKRVDFVFLEIEDLEQYKNLTFEVYSKDRFIRQNVERIIENIANAIIDISKIIIAN
nr:HepT-like ribonuclease domain-containing protein [Caldicellulosiruptor owensensis]